MIIRHTRSLQRSGDAVTSRDGRLVAHCPTEAGWSALGLIDLGGRATVVALLGPSDTRAFRFLTPDGAPLASCAVDFLAAPRDGAGPLDWQAEAVLTADDDGVTGIAADVGLHDEVDSADEDSGGIAHALVGPPGSDDDDRRNRCSGTSFRVRGRF